MEKKAYSVSCPLVSTQVKRNIVSSWLKQKNRMMSEIAEQELTNLQALLIVQVMFAFCLLVCSSFTSIVGLYICLTWFLVSVLACKRYVHYAN